MEVGGPDSFNTVGIVPHSFFKRWVRLYQGKENAGSGFQPLSGMTVLSHLCGLGTSTEKA